MSLEIVIHQGDVLDEPADALVCPANVQLNLSGGVNGQLLERGGESIQRALHEWLASNDRQFAKPGEVVVTDGGPTSFEYILHTVAITAFYESDVGLVQDALRTALLAAGRLGVTVVATPALATGYGRQPMSRFGAVLARLQKTVDGLFESVRTVRVVLRTREDVAEVREAMQEGLKWRREGENPPQRFAP